ncbi:MAG: hypothetical protein K2P76_07210 [Lachnospiraceae bacterium]|nr:hypothetical protein [Lachnospiraceae bacterium]MDE6979879.1 hypothetical protein [Lachnospiraceae bacterium]
MEGDADSNYFFYCLHRFHWTPKKFLKLNRYEKAMIIAAIDIKREADKKQEEDLERMRKRR